MEITIDQEQLKNLIKNALVEVLEERHDLLHDAVEEAIEMWRLHVLSRKVNVRN